MAKEEENSKTKNNNNRSTNRKKKLKNKKSDCKVETLELEENLSKQKIKKRANKNKDNKRFKKFIMILGVILLVSVVFFVYHKYDEKQQYIYSNVENSLSSLYSNYKKSIPNDDVTVEDVNKVIEKIKQLNDSTKKEKILNKAKSLKKYILVRDDMNNWFEEDVLKSDITEDDVSEMENSVNSLDTTYKSLLNSSLKKMKKQFKYIQELEEAVTGLFTDDTRTVIKNDVTRDMYEDVLKKVDNVLQDDIKEKERKVLNKVLDEILEREAFAISAREQKINDAWKILNVSYISQNFNGVLNGSYVATLLMGLQYKGYLKDIDIKTYANNILKSSDPFSGFTYSIYDLEPKNVPHWIAPGALAAYGRNTSFTSNVIDITGSSLSDIDKYVVDDNPVIIYLTSNLKSPKKWVEGAPLNVQAFLVAGYNSMTEEQLLIDPWTHDDGTTKWYVSKAKVSKLYNATGKRAVVIK